MPLKFDDASDGASDAPRQTPGPCSAARATFGATATNGTLYITRQMRSWCAVWDVPEVAQRFQW